MHAKFLLPRRADRESAWRGSYNFNRHLRWSNSELLCRTADRGTVAALGLRFAAIAAQPDRDGRTSISGVHKGVT